MFGGWTGDAIGSIEQSWESLDNMSPPSEEKVHATSIPTTSGAHPSKSPTAKVSSREISSSTTGSTPSNLQSLASTASSSPSPLTVSKKSKTLKGTKSPTMKHTKSPTARPSSPTTIKYGSNDATMTMTNACKAMLEQGISISSDANIVSYKTRPSIFLKHGILLGKAKTTMPKELSNVLKIRLSECDTEADGYGGACHSLLQETRNQVIRELIDFDIDNFEFTGGKSLDRILGSLFIILILVLMIQYKPLLIYWKRIVIVAKRIDSLTVIVFMQLLRLSLHIKMVSKLKMSK